MAKEQKDITTLDVQIAIVSPPDPVVTVSRSTVTVWLSIAVNPK